MMEFVVIAVVFMFIITLVYTGVNAGELQE